jgi:nucleotide-binding universal stress UspA family protein
MFERILIPLDGSEITEMAVPYGEELGIRLGSGLSFIMYMDRRNRNKSTCIRPILIS